MSFCSASLYSSFQGRFAASVLLSHVRKQEPRKQQIEKKERYPLGQKDRIVLKIIDLLLLVVFLLVFRSNLLSQINWDKSRTKVFQPIRKQFLVIVYLLIPSGQKPPPCLCPGFCLTEVCTLFSACLLSVSRQFQSVRHGSATRQPP